MSRTTTTAGLLATALLLSFAPMAKAVPSLPIGGSCQGDIEVQVGPYNNYSCSNCAGSIIVQVGSTNDIDCRGDTCSGNIVVQVGIDNSVECASGLLSGSTASSSAAASVPCPPQLPRDNFYCYALGRVLPEEFCLTLDFCLW